VQKQFTRGRSGAFFYITLDKVYVIKTLTQREFRLLLAMLPNYFHYMVSQPKSFLARFLGLYSLMLHKHRKFIVVMNNILKADGGVGYITQIYDLKGSSIGRSSNRGAARRVKRSELNPSSVATLKDNDLHSSLALNPMLAAYIVRQLEYDAAFLLAQGVMDYSVLLGIHTCKELRPRKLHCNATAAPRRFDQTGIKGAGPFDQGFAAAHIEGHGVYHLGIIDFLQPWDWSKRLEFAFKAVVQLHWTDWMELSCIPPKLYFQRFVKMVNRIFLPQKYDSYKILLDQAGEQDAGDEAPASVDLSDEVVPNEPGKKPADLTSSPSSLASLLHLPGSAQDANVSQEVVQESHVPGSRTNTNTPISALTDSTFVLRRHATVRTPSTPMNERSDEIKLSNSDRLEHKTVEGKNLPKADLINGFRNLANTLPGTNLALKMPMVPRSRTQTDVDVMKDPRKLFRVREHDIPLMTNLASSIATSDLSTSVTGSKSRYFPK
jgi:hypothetical protein